MPLLKTYDLFISHAWKYNEEYYRLVELLKGANNFKWRNYSVPEHDPVLDPDDENDAKILLSKLEQQIKPVNCVLVISGMYVNYRKWIQSEIEIAIKYKKPIIGIKPRGQQRIPLDVQAVATTMVGWSTDSIVKAIREHSI